MKRIIYCVDCETTGLDADTNEVIEVCFWRFGDDEPKTWCVAALDASTITEGALRVNGHKRDDILRKTAFGKETYREPSTVIAEIESWVMSDGEKKSDRVFLGQNPTFDHAFLKSLWKRSGSASSFPFGNFLVDTIQIARLIDLCSGRKRPRYNLASLVKDFGVTKRNAHRATEDVKMTRELFDRQVLPIREFIASQFTHTYQT